MKQHFQITAPAQQQHQQHMLTHEQMARKAEQAAMQRDSRDMPPAPEAEIISVNFSANQAA